MDLYTILISALQQKETMELMRLGIIYVHLIACCVAIGLVLTSDITMVKQLLKGQGVHQSSEHLEHLKNVVGLSLVVLWISGIAIIALDASSAGMQYFLNPKLQAKVAIVVLLTINGVVLHNMVLPALQKTGSLLKLPISMRNLAIFSGALSGVSWFYAALLGVGRPLAWKYSLVELMAAYPLMIAGATLGMLALTKWSISRSEEHHQSWVLNNYALSMR
ncbi:hypothetical protein [uncultured Pseudomonas sp.]|uniref:hypothetical protein n=1 Tax=uncultured Pseudomonas sp. TaxID=114707 RepID=UPI00261DC220|nr:hypothetical protein [uncultured Pseudomonas sp.]